MDQERLHDLFCRGLEGDRNAYHFFLKEISPSLRGFFRQRLLHLSDDVEDLLQETLLAIHQHRHTYDPLQPLGPWVYAIARHKVADCYRRASRRELLSDPVDCDSDVFGFCDMEAAEARRDIGKLLAKLPAGQRLPIEHTHLEGLSVKETAQALGLTESAVKIRVFRGMKALAKKIRRNA